MNPRRLLARLLEGHDRNVSFDDFIRLVESFGFRRSHARGSHQFFVHAAMPEVLNLQPRRGEAKPYQTRQFLSLVERYNLTLEERP